MRLRSSNKYLLGTASALVLSTAALVAAAQPANAQATNGLYFGGSTLASEAFRQIFDCYTGATVGNDGFSFSGSFNQATPTPGKLPNGCTTDALTDQTVQGMYAGVGSGNGFRGFISNDPSQWYGGTVTPNTTTSTLIATPFPAAQPPFVDSANSTNFGSYPYPRVDVGLSDSPLASTLAGLTTVAFSFSPSTWASNGVTTSTTQITLNSTTQVAAYNATSFGNPVQIPAFEVNVGVAVNVNSTAFQINSQIKSGGNIVTGGAIQLTEGQLCAIFSGLVTNWGDGLGTATTPALPATTIPYLDSTGAQQAANFDYANVGNGISTAQPYASTSLPIKVVFRSDGSGTSFILTNYLKTVCPLLDPSNAKGYQTIFNASNLPSTSFSNLVTNIQSFRGNGPWTPGTTVAGAWLGASGSGGVAAGVNNNTTNAGNIGYVSADFTQPYANLSTAPTAPLSASLQNESLRAAGTNVPNNSASLTFVAPTPASADTAWGDSALTPPDVTSTWAAWNVYGIKYSTSEPAHNGVAVAGLPVLPLTNQAGAYPLAGTTFLALYSCYGNDTNGTNLIAFLNWFYQTNASDANVGNVLANNGFHQLNTTWLSRVQNAYLAGTSGVSIALASSGSEGCTGVTVGANP